MKNKKIDFKIVSRKDKTILVYERSWDTPKFWFYWYMKKQVKAKSLHLPKNQIGFDASLVIKGLNKHLNKNNIDEILVLKNSILAFLKKVTTTYTCVKNEIKSKTVTKNKTVTETRTKNKTKVQTKAKTTSVKPKITTKTKEKKVVLNEKNLWKEFEKWTIDANLYNPKKVVTEDRVIIQINKIIEETMELSLSFNSMDWTKKSQNTVKKHLLDAMGDLISSFNTFSILHNCQELMPLIFKQHYIHNSTLDVNFIKKQYKQNDKLLNNNFFKGVISFNKLPFTIKNSIKLKIKCPNKVSYYILPNSDKDLKENLKTRDAFNSLLWDFCQRLSSLRKSFYKSDKRIKNILMQLIAMDVLEILLNLNVFFVMYNHKELNILELMQNVFNEIKDRKYKKVGGSLIK